MQANTWWSHFVNLIERTSKVWSDWVEEVDADYMETPPADPPDDTPAHPPDPPAEREVGTGDILYENVDLRVGTWDKILYPSGWSGFGPTLEPAGPEAYTRVAGSEEPVSATPETLDGLLDEQSVIRLTPGEYAPFTMRRDGQRVFGEPGAVIRSNSRTPAVRIRAMDAILETVHAIGGWEVIHVMEGSHDVFIGGSVVEGNGFGDSKEGIQVGPARGIRDVDVAYNLITGTSDAISLQGGTGMSAHHNLIEAFDDGIEFDKAESGFAYQNRFRRCGQSCISFQGKDTGPGMFIVRNNQMTGIQGAPLKVRANVGLQFHHNSVLTERDCGSGNYAWRMLSDERTTWEGNILIYNGSIGENGGTGARLPAKLIGNLYGPKAFWNYPGMTNQEKLQANGFEPGGRWL